MCTKPFSQTKNKGKLFLVAKSSGPLLARMPLKCPFLFLFFVSSKNFRHLYFVLILQTSFFPREFTVKPSLYY